MAKPFYFIIQPYTINCYTLFILYYYNKLNDLIITWPKSEAMSNI